MSTAKKLVKGSFIRNAELAVVLGVNLVVAPFIVRSLGNRMYGFWTLIGTLLGYYGLLDFGLSSATARYISQSLGKGDLDDAQSVASTAFSLFCVVGAATMLVTLVSMAACPLLVHNPADAALLRKILFLLGAGTAIGFPLRVYWGILISYIRFDAIAYTSIARTLLANAGICLFLSLGYGIMAVAVVSFAATLFQDAAMYAICRTQYPQLRISLRRAVGAKVRALLDHSWKTSICTISDIVRMRMDPFVIAGFLKVSLVTPYAIGSSLSTGLTYFLTSSLGMMQPVFSRFEGSGDFAAIRRSLLMVTKISALLTAYFGLSIIYYGPAFIRRWMGPGYDSSAWVAAILCAGCILALPQAPGVQLLYALSKHQSYAAMSASEAVLNFALSVLFLRRFGIYGVALGTTVEILLVKLLVQPVYICRPIGLPVKVYLLDTIFATLLKAAAVLGIYFYLIRGLVEATYGRLLICVAAQTVLFLPAAYLSLGTEERRFVRDVATSLVSRTQVDGSEEANAVL